MAILINRESRVLIQGITGREGSARARFMRDYGTKVVAGVTPGRGGESVHGIPVYNSVEEAISMHGPVDVAVTFVPGPKLIEAVREDIENNIKLVVMPVERVPLHDTMEMVALARNKGITLIGPGSIGVISPGEAVVGWIGGSLEMAQKVFKKGNIGVISRSGGQTTTVSWLLSKNGFGVSTAIHVGSEAVVGTTIAEILELFQADDETHAVVIFGEVGGVMEEEAAELIMGGGFDKPVVAYIVGRGVQRGIRYSHSSVFVEGGEDSYTRKVNMLKEAGAHIAEEPGEIPIILRKIIRR